MRLATSLALSMMGTSLLPISGVQEPSPAPGPLVTSCPTSATPPEASNGQTAASNKSNIFSRPALPSVCTTLHQGTMTTPCLEITNYQDRPSLWMINVAKIKELELAIMMIEFVPNYFATPRITLVATPTDLQWRGLIVERAKCVSMENVQKEHQHKEILKPVTIIILWKIKQSHLIL